MKWLATIHEAKLNLFSSKLRSLLALLGIVVGTASVVAMVSGGELATHEALKQFKTLGTDLLAISLADAPDKAERAGAEVAEAPFSLPQALGLATADRNVLDVAPYTQVYDAVQYNGQTLNASVLGVSESFARIVHVDLMKGRFVSAWDHYALFCVIGHHLYESMKQIAFTDPVGAQLQVGPNFFTVIGVAEPWLENSFVYANVDNAVMIPILSSMALSQYAKINNIIVRLKQNANIEQVNQHLTHYFNQQVPGKRLYFRSAKELIASMAKQSNILTVFLGLIGSISLIVGGIGVMNIMLVSVVERRREIGIRLAVGARRADIRFLFLMEAMMLSLVGGMVGVLLGILIAYVIAWFSHWEFMWFIWPPVIGFSVSVAIGIFFGFYPAHQASRLDPIMALRSE